MNPNTGAWKAFESKVAKLLKTRRTPLSGKASGHHTSSDTLSEDVYAECKWLKGTRSMGAAVLNLWDDTVKNAKQEGKVPMLAMHRRGSRVEFAALPLEIATEALGLWLAHQDVQQARRGEEAL